LFSLISVFIGCSSPKKKKVAKPKVDKYQLGHECKKGISLSCAKLGYYFQNISKLADAHRFYERACRLGDETSCFNMKGISPRDIYFKKLDAIMSFNSNNIINCYSKVSERRQVGSSIQLKEKWTKVQVEFEIDRRGNAKNITVISPFSRGFSQCTGNLVKNLNFPKPGHFKPEYVYSLTIRSFE
jgi:hypothetical protein